MAKARGTFEITNWDEKTYAGGDNSAKLTRASVTQRFTGDIQGDGSVEWLMCYRQDGTADWLGMQRVDGTLQGRSGSFVVQTVGSFDGGAASGTWSVVDGSGSGGLLGLKGSGRMDAPKGATPTYELDYEFG
jgi:Protein of unknown function (DUF3224)